jgi:anti-sigma factor RsiW
VGYFRDRKAAVFVYARRLHPITLLVFRADGLRWPSASTKEAYTTTDRGFTVLMWQSNSLGYALVSDIAAPELHALASKITPR